MIRQTPDPPSAWAGRAQAAFWLPILFGLASTALVLVCTGRHGIGLWGDAGAYISTARSLLAGHGFIMFDGEPLALWPPLFPTVLAFLGCLGLDPVEGVRLLNAAALGGAVVVSGLWFRRAVGSSALALFGTLAVFLSPQLLGVAVYAWSEILFVWLTLATLWALDEFNRTDSLPAMYLAAACAALSYLTRFAGIALVVAGVALLLLRKGSGYARKLGSTIFFGAVAVVPTTLWLARTYLVTRTSTGERWPPTWPVARNAAMALDAIGLWIVPTSLISVGEVLAGLLLLILGACLGRFLWSPVIRQKEISADRLMVPGSFVLVYTAFMIVSASLTETWAIDNRLLCPAYAPLVLVVVLLFERGRELIAKLRYSRVILALGAVACATWLLLPARRLVLDVLTLTSTGPVGYASAEWKTSDLIGYVRSQRLDGRLYSNHPQALYFLAGIRAKSCPRRPPSISGRAPVDSLVRLGRELAEDGGAHLVWFNSSNQPYLYTPEELRDRFEVELVARRSDGAVYRIGPSGDRVFPRPEEPEPRSPDRR